MWFKVVLPYVSRFLGLLNLRSLTSTTVAVMSSTLHRSPRPSGWACRNYRWCRRESLYREVRSHSIHRLSTLWPSKPPLPPMGPLLGIFPLSTPYTRLAHRFLHPSCAHISSHSIFPLSKYSSSRFCCHTISSFRSLHSFARQRVCSSSQKALTTIVSDGSSATLFLTINLTCITLK